MFNTLFIYLFIFCFSKKNRLSTCSPTEACRHNAKIATTHDREDLAQIWKICMEILRDCVPLEITNLDLIEELLLNKQQQQQSDSEPLLGKQTFHHKDEKVTDAAVAIRNYRDATIKMIEELPKSHVRWGSHPLGQKLVDNM